MLKWKYDPSKAGEKVKRRTESNDSSSLSDFEQTPSQLRMNKLLQAYEDYRTQLLEDLDKININSQPHQTTATGKADKDLVSESGQHRIATNQNSELSLFMKDQTTAVPTDNVLNNGSKTRQDLPNDGSHEATMCNNDVQYAESDIQQQVVASKQGQIKTESHQEANKALKLAPDKDVSSGLKNVLHMITCLQSEFDSIKNQLDSSSRSQPRHQPYIRNPKEMCNETSTSAVTSATSHCSSSVADVSDMLHQYKCGFPNSLSGEGWSSSVPRINSYIASLPSPNPGVEKESASSQYTGSEASWSSVAAQQYRAAPPSKHSAAPNLRSTKSSENAARNRLSLPTPRTQSMFDLRPGDGGISKETLYMMEQAEKLRLLRELAKSERKYCGDLWQLTQNYGRLLYSTGALTHRDALQLFPGHLSEMYQLHSSFLRSLNKKIVVWKLNDTCCYGNILSKLTNSTRIDMFALYKDYIERFPGSARILSNASRDSPLLHRVLNKSKLQGGGVGSSKDLLQLLVQPIKMLPLYLAFLKEALYYTGVDNSDICYLQSSADCLDRFLRGNQKSINTCFKLSDAYLAGSHKSRDLGGRSRQGSVSGSTRGSNADSGIESHTDSPRTRRSRRPHTKASGSVDQSAYKRYGLLPKPDPYNHNTSWSAYFHGKDASGRSLQRYNSLRCVPFYENVDEMRRGHSDAKTKSRTPTGKQREQNRSNRVQSSTDDEAYPDIQYNDAIKRLGHSTTYGVGPHSPNLQAAKVRFKTPVAETKTLRRAPSQRISDGKKTSFTHSIKGLFSKK